MNLFDSAACNFRPDELAVAELDEKGNLRAQFSRGQFDHLIHVLAEDLKTQTRPGDAALLMYSAGADFFAAFLACLSAGVIAVPVPALDATRLKRSLPRLDAIIKDSGANLILTSAAQKRILESSQTENPRIFSSEVKIISTSQLSIDSSLVKTVSSNSIIQTTTSCSEIAYLQYTSGSTGDPKGVEITHEALVNHCVALKAAWGYTSQSISVTWMPHFHDYGLVDGLLMPFFNGTPVFILSPVGFLKRPHQWLEALGKYEGSHTQAPNFAYDYCVERIKESRLTAFDLSKVEVFSNGAEPVQESTLSAFYQKFSKSGLRKSSLFPAYGLAEATLLVATKPVSDLPKTIRVDRGIFEKNGIISVSNRTGDKSIVSCGIPIFNTDVRVVNPQTHKDLGEGLVGEIWVNSPAVARGYWKDPVKTESVFGAELSNDPSSGRYLRTGDLGFLFENELYPTGRIKDLLILNGVNIYPQDIEAAICSAVPAVRSGYVAAFTGREPDSNNLVVMAETKRADCASIETARQIQNAVISEFDFCPTKIVLVGKGGIQKTSSGKIQRNRCREVWIDNMIPVRLEISTDDLIRKNQEISVSQKNIGAQHEWLKRQVASLVSCSIELIREDTNFHDLGLDSKSAVSLVSEIEEQLELTEELPISIIWEHSTIRRLSEALRALTGAKEFEVTPSSRKEVIAESNHEIAVVGLSCRFPGADSPEGFWEVLSAGSHVIRPLPEERKVLLKRLGIDLNLSTEDAIGHAGFVDRIDYFDSEFFGVSAREASGMDPQQRMVLESVKSAFERSAIDPGQWRGKKVGVFVGVANADFGRHIFRSDQEMDSYAGPSKASSIVANRVSYCFDFRGPSMTIDTACSSSLVAVHQAISALKNGECDLAVAGGVNLVLDPAMSRALRAGGMLSESGRSCVFDEAADGYVRGEGVGIVLLKRSFDAISDGDIVQGLLVGSAINQDGNSNGLTAPNPNAQVTVMKSALESGGVDSASVAFVEAHGTGTPLGDPIEVGSINEVYDGQAKTWIGSVKSVIGHLEGAAGIAGLIKALLVLQNRRVPAQASLRTVSRRVDRVSRNAKVAIQSQHLAETGDLWAAVSSFGFGGTNAHVVLKSSPNPVDIQQHDNLDITSPQSYLLPLSAHNKKSLHFLMRSYIDLLAVPSTDVDALCFSAAVGRELLPVRAIVSGQNAGELANSIKNILAESESHAYEPAAKGIVWLFSGQGSQYQGMASQLLGFPVFKNALDYCASLLKDDDDFDLHGALQSESEILQQTQVAQPIIFSFEYALAQLYFSFGMKPAAVAGHSLGELTAACVAGIIPVEEMLPFVRRRSEIMSQVTTSGAMLGAQLNVAHAQKYLLDFPGVEIGAVNSDRAVVFSGETEAVSSLDHALKHQQIYTKVLRVSHAFHSAHLSPILGALEREALYFKPQIGAFPIFSNVSGKEISGDQMGAEYWVSQARKPVLFGDCLRQILTENSGVLEIGPGGALSTFAETVIEEHFSLEKKQVCAGIINSESAEFSIKKAVSLHFSSGSTINWKSVYSAGKRRKHLLPDYPFTRSSHWPTLSGSRRIRSSDNEFYLSKHVILPAENMEMFSAQFSSTTTSFLNQHVVFDRIVVPGAGLIALIGCAQDDSDSNKTDMNLEDITFMHPLSFEDYETREVQMTLPFQEMESGSRFQISSFRPDDPQSSYVNHVSGYRKVRKQSVSLATESVKELQSQITKTGVENFYDVFWQASIALGPGFRWIKSVAVSNNEVVTLLQRPDHSLSRKEELTGFLDSVFQGLLAGVSLQPGHALVPFAIDEIFLALDLVKSSTWVKIRIEDEEHLSSGIKADFHIFSNDGRVMGRIRGFRARRVPEEAWMPADKEFEIGVYKRRWNLVRSDQLVPLRYEKFFVIAEDENFASSLSKSLTEVDGAELEVSVYTALRDFCEKLSPDLSGLGDPVQGIVSQSGKSAAIISLGDQQSSSSSGFSVDETVSRVSDLDLLYRCAILYPSLDVILATEGGFEISDRLDSQTGPTTHAAIGYVRSANHESESSLWRIIDLDRNWSRQQSALQLGRLAQRKYEAIPEIVSREGSDYYWDLDRIAPSSTTSRRYDVSEACVISGGLGGLGLAVAERLAEKGVRNIWLLGRTDPSPIARGLIDGMMGRELNLIVCKVDIEEQDQVAEVFTKINEAGHVCTGIYHCAGVVDDRPAGGNSRSGIATVIRPKLLGAHYLDQFSSDHQLREFVLFSSVAAAFGNAGQTAYSAANAAMMSIAERRVSRGLPVTLIDWGPWNDVGMAARRGPELLAYLSQQGYRPMENRAALGLMEQAIGDRHVSVIAAGFRSSNVESTSRIETPKGRSSDGQSQSTDFTNRLIEMKKEDRVDTLSEYLLVEIGAALKGLDKSQQLDHLSALFDLGLDSLGAVELRNRVGRELGLKLRSTLLFDYPNVAALSEYLADQIESLFPDARYMKPEPANSLAEDGLDHEPPEDDIAVLLSRELEKT